MHDTEWLALKQASCLSKDGKHFKWDYVSRQDNQKIVILLCRDLTKKKILLLKEYRAPLEKWVIEFPKGIINTNESIEQTALRELKEETGYSGKVLEIHPFMATSAYLTDETTSIVEIEIDEKTLSETKQDAEEEIEAFWLAPEDFLAFINTLEIEFIMESNVWFYFRSYL